MGKIKSKKYQDVNKKKRCPKASPFNLRGMGERGRLVRAGHLGGRRTTSKRQDTVRQCCRDTCCYHYYIYVHTTPALPHTHFWKSINWSLDTINSLPNIWTHISLTQQFSKLLISESLYTTKNYWRIQIASIYVGNRDRDRGRDKDRDRQRNIYIYQSRNLNWEIVKTQEYKSTYSFSHQSNDVLTHHRASRKLPCTLMKQERKK